MTRRLGYPAQRDYATQPQSGRYSADGDRWHKARKSRDEAFHAAAWNGERYVAVSHSGLIMYSADGERWHTVDSANGETLEDVRS